MYNTNGDYMTTMSDFLETPIDERSNTDDAFVGIEIELENITADAVLDRKLDNLKYWNCVEDGSLKRKGVEFVNNAPTLIDNVPEAINELWDTLEGCSPLVTSRTSIHVHVDVLNMTVDEFINYVTLSILLERVLYTIGGLHRIHNNNCIPVGNTNLPMNFLHYIRGAHNRINWPKYTGINVGSVTYNVSENWSIQCRGTIEFRMHEGTFDNEEVFNWVSLLQHLKDIAMDPLKYKELMSTVAECNGQKVLDTFNSILDTHVPYVYSAYKQNTAVLLKDIMNGYQNVLCLQMNNLLEQTERDILNNVFYNFNGRPIKAIL